MIKGIQVQSIKKKKNAKLGGGQKQDKQQTSHQLTPLKGFSH